MLTTGLFSSNKDDWCTPLDLFSYLDNKFHFDVDLCASDDNHLCDEYCTISKSCFDCTFINKVIFCNPPYGRRIGDFVALCYHLSFYNKVVMLLPARTDTKWFHTFIYKKAHIKFLRGRLHFSGSKNAAPFPSMIVWW